MTTTQAPVTTWAIDPTHSQAEFAVRHLMISTVKGRFGAVAGTVTGDSVEATIQTASIITHNDQRDAHLKSADFFDVEKFPTITFKSRRIDGDVGGDFTLVGDLTMHGVTKEIVLDVAAEGSGKDPWGGERRGFSAKTKIDRRDWGLAWNQALETGGVTVGHDIKISIDVELVRSAS